MRQLLHQGFAIYRRAVVGVVLAIGVAGLVCAGSPAVAKAAGPSITIVAPQANATYSLNEEVMTEFECTSTSEILSCLDSYGEPPGGSLDTSQPGQWTFTVIASDSTGESTASVTYTVAAVSRTLVNTSPPTVTGTPKVGSRLTASPGTWNPTPTTTHYFWQRCTRECADIDGATTSTYTVTAADIGAKLRVTVIATAGRARASAVSAAVGPVPRSQVGPTGPTSAQIKAALLKQLMPYGKAAKLGTVLRKHGYEYDCTAPTRGTMTISWYQVPKGAHLSRAAKPVLIATGRRSFTRAGKAHMTIKLTRAGTSLLKRSRQVKLSAKASFARTGAAQVSAIKPFTLKR